uniref:Uncharacterized protein n=1 Tax=Eutreptiella gymnastica TaxID=73025 RepID=A0A7S4G724_9EUGL
MTWHCHRTWRASTPKTNQTIPFTPPLQSAPHLRGAAGVSRVPHRLAPAFSATAHAVLSAGADVSGESPTRPAAAGRARPQPVCAAGLRLRNGGGGAPSGKLQKRAPPEGTGLGQGGDSLSPSPPCRTALRAHPSQTDVLPAAPLTRRGTQTVHGAGLADSGVHDTWGMVLRGTHTARAAMAVLPPSPPPVA